MHRTPLGLIVLFVLASPPRPAPAEAPRDSTLQEKNKAVARRVFDEIFNQHRLQVAYEIYAPDFVNHGQSRDYTLAEDQAAVRGEVKAFPDVHITTDLMVAEGDLVTVIWTFHGTHTGFGYGLPPTGTKVQVRGITVWRIVGGRIHDEWSSFNTTPMYLQALRHLRWPLAGAAVLLALLAWGSVRLIRRWRRPGAAAASGA